ncbi:MAG: hypothetical protein RJB57_1375 [Actinomycetota bacterium]
MAAGRCTGFTVDLRGERVRLRGQGNVSVPRAVLFAVASSLVVSVVSAATVVVRGQQRGPVGASGAVGATGETGPAGPQGVPGARGVVGPVGPRGDDGDRGPRGVRGARGARGITGAQGAQGLQGPSGAQGASGAQGPAGAQGERGPQGERGAQGADGPVGPQGPAGGFGAYGSFYDTTSVPLPRYAATPVPLNSTDFASGVSIVDGSKITFAVAGKFNILFSSQIEKGDAGTDVMSVWLTRRGANVPWTNTDTVLTSSGSNSRHIVALNFFVDVTAGDWFQLMMTSTTSSQTVIRSVGAQTNPDRPEIPGTILTVNQVG